MPAGAGQAQLAARDTPSKAAWRAAALLYRSPADDDHAKGGNKVPEEEQLRMHPSTE